MDEEECSIHWEVGVHNTAMVVVVVVVVVVAAVVAAACLA